MAIEPDQIYLGLLRPAKIIGLPLGAAAVWVISTLFVFLWTESLMTLLIGACFYPVFWGLTQWDQHFFSVISATIKDFGINPNKSVWGGYSYEP